MAVDVSPQAMLDAAKCYQCNAANGYSLDLMSAALLMQFGGNLIPPGSMYNGAPPEFDLVVLPNTNYVITWGSNDLSMTLCGVNYPSTGIGPANAIAVNTGSCTLMQFFGTFAGTRVTAKVQITGTPPPPALPKTNLVLQLESDQFDASSNGSNITTWSDASGSVSGGTVHDFVWATDPNNQGNVFGHPLVDGTNTLKGHKTVQFPFTGIMGSGTYAVPDVRNRWLDYNATGLSMLVIAKWASNNPAPDNHAGSPVQFTYHQHADPLFNVPYTDGNFYDGFGSNARLSMGAPGVNLTTAFRKYKVIANAASLKAYMDGTNFYTNNAYTFSVNGNPDQASQQSNYQDKYLLGITYSNILNIAAWLGNIAAVYVWEKALSAAEQTALDAYILNKWGI